MSANPMRDDEILDRNIELISGNLNNMLHEEQECVIPVTFEMLNQLLDFGILPRNPYYETGDMQLKSVPLITKSAVVRNDTNKRNHKKSKPKKDYDNIIVDMSLLGFSNNCFERSNPPIVRLMELFRQMYYFLHDILDDESGYSNETNKRVTVFMPQTLNIQIQLENAEVQCISFLCEMRNIVYSDNIVLNNDLYNICICSIKKMHDMIIALNEFKQYQLEHKNGQWTGKSQVFGEYLETFLQQLNDQIRETHIHVHVFAWDQRRTQNATQFLEEQHCVLSALNGDVGDNFCLKSCEEVHNVEVNLGQQINLTTRPVNLPLILGESENSLSQNQCPGNDIGGNGKGNIKRNFLRYIGSK